MSTSGQQVHFPPAADTGQRIIEIVRARKGSYQNYNLIRTNKLSLLIDGAKVKQFTSVTVRKQKASIVEARYVFYQQNILMRTNPEFLANLFSNIGYLFANGRRVIFWGALPWNDVT